MEGIKKNREKKLFFTEKVPDFSIGSCPCHRFDMENASDFKLLDRKAVESVLAMPERSMFFRRHHPG